MSTPTPASALSVRAHTVAIDDPGDLWALLPDPSGLAWLRHGEGLVGWGEALRIPLSGGPGRFERAAATLRELFDRADVTDDVGQPGTGPVAFGAFTFDPEQPGSVLVIPRVVVGHRHGRTWRTTIAEGSGDSAAPVPTPPAPPERVRYAGSSLSEVRWLEAVDRAVGEIHRGAYGKVVLARDRRVWSKAPFDARVLVQRLAGTFPDCYTFACDGLVGATPELLVRRMDGVAQSTVLAGSAARGADPAADRRLGEGLVHAAKDREEHAFAVESVRTELATLCAELTVDPRPHLLRLANVQHLATNLRGRLHTPVTALEIAGRLHPTAAVCGTPTATAMEAIRALEGMDRSRYSGPVGWVDGRGDGEWGIALRCAELDGARARLFAGAGIVAASLPEAELEETRIKLRAMQSAFEG